jgi:hypothetical protein
LDWISGGSFGLAHGVIACRLGEFMKAGL